MLKNGKRCAKNQPTVTVVLRPRGCLLPFNVSWLFCFLHEFVSNSVILGLCAFLLPCLSQAAEIPQAQISNGLIHARLYLPDAQNGYYRATRFDWAGVFASLEYQGHNYFGQWFEHYDPKVNDSISGPVEEFFKDKVALGYDRAKAGGTFIRIGVGVLRKPEEARFDQFKTYDIVDAGTRATRSGPDWIEFTQKLNGPFGYAYLYRKTVRLTPGKPELLLEHTLKNTGRTVIETSVYDHNMFVIDHQPTGPDFVLQVPFDLRATRDLNGLAVIQGHRLAYLQQLRKGQTVYTGLQGFGASLRDYDIRVENHKVGAGVRITGDRPLSEFVLWSIRTVLSPEPYLAMRVEPGQEFTWRIAYNFYTLPAQSP